MIIKLPFNIYVNVCKDFDNIYLMLHILIEGNGLSLYTYYFFLQMSSDQGKAMDHTT